ncbi:MAG: 50S ribosomal protein L7/L12 [Candidatus Babeliales bacterium]|nr:50S ribosomal protein L7/L12 [Candidatus Babeliales bacterium]
MANVNNREMIDSIGKMTTLELSRFVKELQEEFGVSAAMMAPSSAPAAEAAPKAEEKTEYKVTLKTSGEKAIEVIKALRKVTTMTLTDAKKAVEEVPTVIAEAASKDDAAKMKETLEAAGAKVELS